MPSTGPASARRGRRGRRTGLMVRVAQGRISDLFGLAEQESRRAGSKLPERYVALARRIGMRYNVRLLREYRELYCRGCGAYWVEGRTVRTRLRSGRRSRTCLRCGRIRRTPLGAHMSPSVASEPVLPAAREAAPALAGDPFEDEGELDEGEDE